MFLILAAISMVKDGNVMFALLSNFSEIAEKIQYGWKLNYGITFEGKRCKFMVTVPFLSRFSVNWKLLVASISLSVLEYWGIQEGRGLELSGVDWSREEVGDEESKD